MTEFLTGNYLNWCQSIDGFGTSRVDGGRDFKTYTPDIFRRLPVVSQVITKDDLILMNFGGTFQGMIVHIKFNDMLLGAVTEFEFIKTTNGGTTVVNTGVKIVIPGNDFIGDPVRLPPTGFFYSNTDVPEFTRTWEPNEFIGIKVGTPPGLPNQSARGIEGGTLMICMDLDLPEPIPPPP